MAEVKIKNRRKGPDSVVKIITYFNFLTWLIIIASLIIYSMGAPGMGSYHIARESMLDPGNAVIVIKMLLFVNVIIAIWGIIANSMRNKRKNDKFHISLIVSSLLSLVGFIFAMVIL